MSDEKSSEDQDYETRLQRRLKILAQQMEGGKVFINEGLQVVESLKKVRYASDGSVDLDTVDGLVRSMALAVEAMHDREESKKSAPLSEIQSTYFEFLERNFGHFYKIMLKKNLSPHDAGLALSKSGEGVAELIKNLPDFLKTINEFWEELGSIAIAHVEDMSDSLKGVFGGDLFPSPVENIASKCGLYTDTIVLPDPYLRSRHVFESVSDEKKAYYLIKHALNLLQYKELACADVVPPIVVVLPDTSALESAEKEYYYSLGREDAVVHGGKVFGREFKDFEELLEFCQDLDTIERVEAEVRDPSRILFDTDWKGNLREQFSRFLQDPNHSGLLGTTNPGLIIASQGLGRMSTSNELLIKARRLRGTPIIDAPTSWQYLAWKMEYDAVHAEELEGIDQLHVVRGLQTLSGSEMQWLGNIPPRALIEVRKSGALAEVREILSKGVDELAHSNPKNFHRTSDKVFDNINSAFSAHRENIKTLSDKKWRFAGTEIGSWLVVGTLAVTAAATGAPVWGLAALAADQLLPSPKLRDIPKSIKELAAESAKLKLSPVGILFTIGGQK